jgi:hypothetical protein
LLRVRFGLPRAESETLLEFFYFTVVGSTRRSFAPAS